MDKGELKCNNNHFNEKPKPRYKVEDQAVHKDYKAKFLLRDTEVTSIIGISTEDLKEEMIKFHPKIYSPTLDKLLCPNKVFKIKALPGSNPCRVIQISDNEQLLKNLKKQYGLEEVISKLAIVGQMSDADDKDVSNVHIQSLYGENDSLSTSPTPPPKRFSQYEVDWIASSQDV